MTVSYDQTRWQIKYLLTGTDLMLMALVCRRKDNSEQLLILLQACSIVLTGFILNREVSSSVLPATSDEEQFLIMDLENISTMFH